MAQPTKLPKITWWTEDTPNPKIQRKQLWGVVEKFTGYPPLLEFTSKLIRKYNVPERDEVALARAVQVFAQNNIKFFREQPERFTNPVRTIAWGFGDCDDKTIVIATILRSFRIPVRLKFIRFNVTESNGNIKHVSHVYPQAKLKGKWVALESVHKWEMGDDPEDRAKLKGITPEIHTIGDK